MLNLLVKPFWLFGIDRSIQLAVGESAYGFYFALFNFSIVFNIILDMGITNYNSRNIAQHQFLLTKHFSNLVVLKFILAFFYAIVSLSIALLLGYRGEQLNMLYLLMFNQFLVSFILYLRSNITALQMFKTDSIISVADRTLMIAICSYLLWGRISDNPFRIEWFVYAQTVSYIVTAIVGLVIVLSKAKNFRLNFDMAFNRVMLKQCFPYALLVLLMAFYNRIDAIMIERILPEGNVDAGIYAQGYRLLDAATMIGYLFAGLLLPIFAFQIKNNDNVAQIVKLALMLLIVPAFLLTLGSVFFRYDIIQFLYHHRDPYSVNIFGILILGFVPIATTYIFGTLLTANGSIKQLNITATFSMAINIILNLTLVPRYQATGAAIASFSAQTFAAVSQVYIAVRIFKFAIRYKLVFKFIVLLVSMILLGLVISYLRSIIELKWWYWLFIYLTVSFFMSIMLKLFKFKGIYDIIKHDR